MKRDRAFAFPRKFRIVKDDLPPPGKLWIPDDGIKVTLKLSRPSVRFFKTIARKSGAPYQRLIRDLVDHYVGRHRRAA